MTKKDIAQRIHQEAGITEEKTILLLNGIQFFKSTLQQGEQISIPTFGVFTVRSKASSQMDEIPSRVRL
jgi:nucleoid DNA-binding protein